MRVRASAGLDVDSYWGAFYKPANSPTDVYLPAIDCDKALLARLSLTDKLTVGSEAYLQVGRRPGRQLRLLRTLVRLGRARRAAEGLPR